MTAYKIDPKVYVYHYDKGFIGPDAMGWDPNLQFAWSRLGAAQTCGIAFDQAAMVARLNTRFGQSSFVHELNGIGFHHRQSKGNPAFCTPERVHELNELMPKFAQGDFPKKF